MTHIHHILGMGLQWVGNGMGYKEQREDNGTFYLLSNGLRKAFTYRKVVKKTQLPLLL